MKERVKGEVSASGHPYTGDPETDAVLDDQEVVARLEREKALPSERIPWAEAKRRLHGSSGGPR